MNRRILVSTYTVSDPDCALIDLVRRNSSLRYLSVPGIIAFIGAGGVVFPFTGDMEDLGRRS